ncbi:MULTISPECIES: glycosyltransferase [Actibacterium]|uniref:Glycosyltransferase involved in cell wall biosynthesis n=1 Tax=Actibacterium naphthalenivorans TaxID=1614693 RepID=A0A840C702_9RHOB|nr:MULTISPECIES: glycosyltransferase [Actibacterium]ALG89210.1 hypothetical protein TQ29_02265 [Actibacterium sp. EMB200-NS6]MBB4021205.1 glycosyltransferase involved in cell wall biosynthesis [Actibacterium naphthalenivorans]
MSLNILVTVDAVGGVWRYAVDLAAALATEGYGIAFAGFGPEPDAAQRAEARSIGTLDWSDAPLDWMATGPQDLAKVASWLMSVAHKRRTDLMHFNQPALAAGLRGGPPRLGVTHSCLATWFQVMENGCVPDRLSWQVDMTRAGLRNLDRIAAPSAAHAALTERVYDLHGIVAVPNAGRSPLIAPDEGDGSVIAVARWWDRAKNGAVLHRAALLSGATVTMIGDAEGPNGQRFEPNCAPAPTAQPHDATLQRIARSSLFVSPSLYEPFGLAALEAARAGRPLLLADIPVYREIWGEAARFFNPHDPAELARAMTNLLDDPATRLALGRAAQDRALRYSMDEQVQKTTALYAGIIADAQVTS